MGWLGDVVGGLFQPIVSGLGIAADWYQQNRQFKYDQKLQETIFEREDNATVRRAADLEAAGLSKTLAAGNAAGVGQAIRAQVPGAGLGNRGAEAIMLQSALMKQKADIAKTQEDVLRTRQEKFTSMAQQRYFDELATKLNHENIPLNALLNDDSFDDFSVDPDTGKLVRGKSGDSIAHWLGKMYYGNNLNNYKIMEDNKLISSANAIKADYDAQISGSTSLEKTWDLDKTRSYGVRSYDKIDAAMEEMFRQANIGKEGTPYATAARQFALDMINAVAGLLKR